MNAILSGLDITLIAKTKQNTNTHAQYTLTQTNRQTNTHKHTNARTYARTHAHTNTYNLDYRKESQGPIETRKTPLIQGRVLFLDSFGA